MVVVSLFSRSSLGVLSVDTAKVKKKRILRKGIRVEYKGERLWVKVERQENNKRRAGAHLSLYIAITDIRLPFPEGD